MRPFLALALAGLLSGCASSTVTLLKNREGPTGAVAVFDAGDGEELGVLTEPNTRARLGGREFRPEPVTAEPYENLLAYLPPPPRAYVMYFLEGTTDLTAESAPILEALRAVVTEASDVQITGHTDSLGSREDNDRLSYERAVEIRAALVKKGLPVANARVTGRGERELRVQTPDGVREPANRRVEVTLR